jgi:hypothetical protein
MEFWLDSSCGGYCETVACAQAVKQAPSGRWFITMGHAGFNSRANNRDGYASREKAEAAYRRYSNS